MNMRVRQIQELPDNTTPNNGAESSILRQPYNQMKGETHAFVPTTVNSSVRKVPHRRYLTATEIEQLMTAARKGSRWGHRDASMILIAYRHGLRASELCDLQWHQVELNAGRLHVRRAKNGSASVHPLQARPTSPAAQNDDGVCVRVGTERPDDTEGVSCPVRPNRCSRQHAVAGASSHAAAWVWLRPCQRWAGHPRPAGMAWAQEHPAHGALYRACARSVQEFLAVKADKKAPPKRG